jgi:hypothetical protein
MAKKAVELDRAGALAKHLGVGKDEVEHLRENEYASGGAEYLVLTDKEADEATEDYIKESVWAFNADFVVSHAGLPSEAEEMVRTFQEAKSEDANETLKALIEHGDGMKEFVSDAIQADGRGHFLSHYDGEENEADGWFIYRTN